MKRAFESLHDGNLGIDDEDPLIYLNDSEDEHEPIVFKPSGVFEVEIPGIEGRKLVMVDTGAEISLVRDTLAEEIKEKYPVDLKGASTGMKNVSGKATWLKGRFNKLPLDIGGNTYRERLYIAQDWHSNYDIILGLLFMGNASCLLAYNTPKGDVMFAFPKGNLRKDPVLVNLRPSREITQQFEINMAQYVETSESEEEIPLEPIPRNTMNHPTRVPSSYPDEETPVSPRILNMNNRWEATWMAPPIVHPASNHESERISGSIQYGNRPLATDKKFIGLMQHLQLQSQEATMPLSQKELRELYENYKME